MIRLFLCRDNFISSKQLLRNKVDSFLEPRMATHQKSISI